MKGLKSRPPRRRRRREVIWEEDMGKKEFWSRNTEVGSDETVMDCEPAIFLSLRQLHLSHAISRDNGVIRCAKYVWL